MWSKVYLIHGIYIFNIKQSNVTFATLPHWNIIISEFNVFRRSYIRHYGNELVYHEQYSTVKVHTSKNLYIFFNESINCIYNRFIVFYAFPTLDLVKTETKSQGEFEIEI